MAKRKKKMPLPKVPYAGIIAREAQMGIRQSQKIAKELKIKY